MTIKLLTPYNDYPAGARLSRDLVFESTMVDTGKATFDLAGSFQWPKESTDEILGPFSSALVLEAAYPAAKYTGFTALVGEAAPYAVYFSDGQTWLAKVGGSTNPLSGVITLSAAGIEIPNAGPAFTFAGLPSAVGLDGVTVRVTDVGPVGMGSLWISDGARWVPLNGSALLCSKNGSVATPIATASAAGKIVIPSGDMVVSGGVRIPSGLLALGRSLYVEAKYHHRGTTGTWGAAVRLGTTDTASDSAVFALAGTATNNQDIWITKEALPIGQNAFLGDGFATPNSMTQGAFTDKGANFDTALPMTLGFYASSLTAGDFVDLLSYRVEVRG